MSLTEDMSLTQEKKRLIQAAVTLSEKNDGEDHNTDSSKDSYYKPYEACRHFDEEISVYNSEELPDLRAMLTRLWADEQPVRKEILPILLAAYSKTRDDEENYLEEIDVINYMM